MRRGAGVEAGCKAACSRTEGVPRLKQQEGIAVYEQTTGYLKEYQLSCHVMCAGIEVINLISPFI